MLAMKTSNETDNEKLRAALTRIANEPCDHGPMDFCPREVARAALALAGEEVQP